MKLTVIFLAKYILTCIYFKSNFLHFSDRKIPMIVRLRRAEHGRPCSKHLPAPVPEVQCKGAFNTKDHF